MFCRFHFLYCNFKLRLYLKLNPMIYKNYSRGITSKRAATNGGIHLRGLAPGQNYPWNVAKMTTLCPIWSARE